MQDFPLSHSWWTTACIFSGSVKELIALEVLGAVLRFNRRKEIVLGKKLAAFPPTPLLLMPAIPRRAGISFSCGSQPRAQSSSLGTPGRSCVICWSQALAQRASLATLFPRNPLSPVALWAYALPLSPTGSKTRGGFCLIRSAPLLSRLRELYHNDSWPRFRGGQPQQSVVLMGVLRADIELV